MTLSYSVSRHCEVPYRWHSLPPVRSDHWEASSCHCKETMCPQKSPLKDLICLRLLCFWCSCVVAFVSSLLGCWFIFSSYCSGRLSFLDTGVFVSSPCLSPAWLCGEAVYRVGIKPEQQHHLWWEQGTAGTVSQRCRSPRSIRICLFLKQCCEVIRNKQLSSQCWKIHAGFDDKMVVLS